MPAVEWKNEYSVGVKKIDNEHRLLLAMINKAYDCIRDNKDQEAVKELTEDMREYAFTHFATEAGLMKQTQYPDMDDHLLQHKDFLLHATPMAKMFDSEEEREAPIKVLFYLADWLKDHIQGADKELGIYLNEQGIE